MKWLPDNELYRKACENADLKNFKQDPAYAAIVGNDTRDYATTRRFYDAVSDMDYCFENDILGNPRTHLINNQKVSCGTLRYMKVKKDLQRWNFDSVVEIGGGYGGQRLVMSDVENYGIVDIDEALDLAVDYLHHERIEVFTFFMPDYLVKDYSDRLKSDLCLSDYALCEFDEELMDFYIENVVKNCKYGYFTVNMNFEMLEEKLSKYFTLKIEDENPRTSKHLNKIYYAEAKY